jgi:hypothetical protein
MQTRELRRNCFPLVLGTAPATRCTAAHLCMPGTASISPLLVLVPGACVSVTAAEGCMGLDACGRRRSALLADDMTPLNRAALRKQASPDSRPAEVNDEPWEYTRCGLYLHSPASRPKPAFAPSHCCSSKTHDSEASPNCLVQLGVRGNCYRICRNGYSART